MTRVYVKNGTPVEGESLCYTCTNAHIRRGYRASEEHVFCNYVYEQLFPILFNIRECTGYADKNKPTWEQMKDLAIEVRPSVSFKPIGFKRKNGSEDVAEDDEEVATK